MKLKKLITVAAISVTAGLAFIPAAHAGESGYPVLKSYGPEKTRAEVKQELKEAYEQGFLPVSDSAYPVLPQEKTPKTRAQIKNELEQSKRSSENKRIEREQYSG